MLTSWQSSMTQWEPWWPAGTMMITVKSASLWVSLVQLSMWNRSKQQFRLKKEAFSSETACQLVAIIFTFHTSTRIVLSTSVFQQKYFSLKNWSVYVVNNIMLMEIKRQNSATRAQRSTWMEHGPHCCIMLHPQKREVLGRLLDLIVLQSALWDSSHPETKWVERSTTLQD